MPAANKFQKKQQPPKALSRFDRGATFYSGDRGKDFTSKALLPPPARINNLRGYFDIQIWKGWLFCRDHYFDHGFDSIHLMITKKEKFGEIQETGREHKTPVRTNYNFPADDDNDDDY